MNGGPTLGILGPGTLGLSAAQWAAECGLQVRLYGRDLAHGVRGAEELARRWAVLVHRDRIRADQREEFLERITPAGPDEGFEGLFALLEALPEDPTLKADLWRQVMPRLESDTLALTGSSALPVGALAAQAGKPGGLIGFHLFVPVRSMPVLELVAPEGADEARIEKAIHLGGLLRKQVVRVRDIPGYAAARMALAQGIEAMRLLEEGVADAGGLDALMTGGYGHPIGPLALSDWVGLDLRLTILQRLHQATGEARFRPPRILEELVARGRLGRRSGHGFHDWNEESPA